LIRGVRGGDAGLVRSLSSLLSLVTLSLVTSCGAAPPRAVASPRVTRSKQDAGVPTADCGDRARAERAVGLALAHAVEAGVSRAHLEGCSFEPARCGDSPSGPEPDARACTVSVDVSYGVWRVEVRPAARGGAPRWLEVTLDEALTLPPARTWVSASTTAVSPRRHVVIRGEEQRRSHAHGGEPASVGSARFEIRHDGPGPLRVSVRRVEWLTSPTCDGAFVVRATPRASGLALDDGAPAASVHVPPGTTTVEVEFDAQSAYYAYCDRFAARVTFDVEGERVRATAEWLIARREPLSRR
jgi:hypothetical protein